MAELRDKTTSFAAKQSEKDRIKKVAEHLDIGMSEFMRPLVMKEVEKVERQIVRENKIAGEYVENTDEAVKALEDNGYSLSYRDMTEKYILAIYKTKSYRSSNVIKNSMGTFKKFSQAEEL